MEWENRKGLEKENRKNEDDWKDTQPYRSCIAYLREFPVFDRLLRGFREKYHSYGSFSGSVVLRGLKMDEIETLEGFFQKSFHGRKSVSVSASGFQDALEKSRFAGLEPKRLLELYFGEKMEGKRELAEEKERRWQELLAKLRKQYEGTPARDWLWQQSDEGKPVEEQRLILGARIINAFPCWEERTEYLAVFAARLTGDPHAFDRGTEGGQFLYSLIQWLAAQREMNTEASSVFPVLFRQKVYLAAGILWDDVSNYAMLCGVRAWRKGGNLHAGMDGFVQEGDPVQAPLTVIHGWERVECVDNEVYIVENPSVYAMLCSRWRGKHSCMCMNGQPRLSSLLVLDLLADAGATVFYAGDFDPEGLLIAERVKRYYQGKVVFWRMSVKDYRDSLSEKTISGERMKKLEAVRSKELLETVSAIQSCGKAGYQENIWERYFEGR